ncbi:Uncharacterised protein [Streptococcus pneumoniae]|nr:Uncharacterised protein [Streptococcus pneumoniae]
MKLTWFEEIFEYGKATMTWFEEIFEEEADVV